MDFWGFLIGYSIIATTVVFVLSKVLLKDSKEIKFIKIRVYSGNVLVFFLIVVYGFFILLDAVQDEKTGIAIIVALLAKLGELLVIPIAIWFFKLNNANTTHIDSTKEQVLMTEKVVTTTTTKVELEDGSVVEQVRVVERTGENGSKDK